jgi:hypothetical protein
MKKDKMIEKLKDLEERIQAIEERLKLMQATTPSS